VKIANEQRPGQSEYLTKSQIAERLKVTTRTIDAWMQKGLIPYRKIGRTVRFVWEEICEALAMRQRQTGLCKSEAQTGGGIAATLRERAKEIRRLETQSAKRVPSSSTNNG
jgi:excisionase family DNA binding protein